MRSRGETGTKVFTAETMAEQFGVNKGSYTPVPLPKIGAQQAMPSSIIGHVKQYSNALSSISQPHELIRQLMEASIRRIWAKLPKSYGQ